MSADTISTLADWTVSAALMQAAIIIDRKGKPGLISTVLNLCDCSGKGSLSIQVGTYDEGADQFAAHAEAASITPDSLADGSVTPVLALQVLDHKLTDEALFILDGSAWVNFIAERANGFAEQADTRISSMICDAFQNFTDVTGTADEPLTVDDLFVGRAFITAMDSGSGPVFCVINPVQGAQLATSMRAEGMIQFTADPVMNGLFRTDGTVKGTVFNDVVVIETSCVGSVSSNYRGGMYRRNALVYGHGIPQGLSTWSPRARRLAIAPGDVAMYLAKKKTDMGEKAADVISQLSSGNLIPEVYVEIGREGTLGNRQVMVCGSFFSGVSARANRGTSLRSKN